MSYMDPYGEDEEDYVPSRNYLVRHWKGQNSLPFAYWVNGFVLTIALTAAVTWISDSVEAAGASLRIIAAAALGLIAISLLSWIWSLVGIWRSANRHPYRGGSSGWATAAKFMMFVGCLGMLARTPGLFLQTRELAQLAAGSDSLGKSASITIRPDGAMQVDGFLTQGFAERFAAAIKANPNVRTLFLNSPGGRMVEGQRFADQVKALGLVTIAEGECASACVLPYLAGTQRLLGGNGRLGFHQPTFPGASDAERRGSIAEFRNAMIKAGVTPAFASQAVTAAPEDMWYPDFATLVKAHVVTGLDRSAVITDNTNSAATLNKNIPKRLDAYTIFTGARADGLVLEYGHRITLPASQMDRAKVKTSLMKAFSDDVCRDQQLVMMIQAGAIYRYVYRDNAGNLLVQFDIDDCRPDQLRPEAPQPAARP